MIHIHDRVAVMYNEGAGRVHGIDCRGAGCYP